MFPIRTLVFDVSGVLLNDLSVVWKADSEAYEKCGMGKIENIEKFKQSFKLPIYDYHRSMGVPDDLIPEIEREYRRAYIKYNHLIQIFPDVRKILTELRLDNITLGITSNVPSNFLIEHLQRFKLNVLFNAVTGQDDCVKQKPSPEPILLTLRKLGANHKNSAYVGDMEEDIIAGRKAHIRTFAVTRDEGYHPLWKLKRQEPDFLVSNLTELLAVVRRINNRKKGQLR
jgi:HAD superfamily hydrolase (TIGR01549 family)